MDFAAALANLEKSTEQAVQGGDGDDRRRRRSDSGQYHHQQRRNQRPRYSNEHRGNYRGGGRGRDQHDEHRDPLEGMHRFGYRVYPQYKSMPPPGDWESKPKHLCLLAITIDDLPYEHIWRAWAASSPDVHVSLLCHAKYPEKVQSPWLKRRLLTEPPFLGRGKSFADPVYHSHRPEWGKVQITRAMVDLLAASMEVGKHNKAAENTTEPDREADIRFSRRRYGIGNDADNDTELPDEVHLVDKFIFISETCLPVTNLDECAAALLPKWEESWVNARNRDTEGTPKNKYESDQFRDIHRMIPQHCRWKADQWLVLSRPHAEAVLNLDQHMRPSDQLWNSFCRINASDEMYFPTALATLGILKSGGSDSIRQNPVTFCDWSEGMRNPAAYEKGVKDLRRIAKRARGQGCLFARKFCPQLPHATEPTGLISVEEWKTTLEELKDEEPPKDAEKVEGNSEEKTEVEDNESEEKQDS